jgi:nucleotide-binding universal stress UspA family protein
VAVRDLLVHVDHTDSGVQRLNLAADLAARHGARLTVLYVAERTLAQLKWLKAAELGLAPAADVERYEEEIEIQRAAHMARLQELTARAGEELGIDAVWRSVTGSAAKLVPQLARYADLTIVGQNQAPGDHLPEGYSFAETMLFLTGRPVILVPGSVGAHTLGRHIAIAWNGSRPSARAVSDALPLIERADRTHVLRANPSHFDQPDRPATDEIITHLSRHDSQVESSSLDVGRGSVGDALQAKAMELGADLLVAGAYGHARLWEKMLGGVTHDLLARMALPVLMSH